MHVDQIFSFPSGDPAEFAGMTEDEMAELDQAAEFSADKSATTSCSRRSRRTSRTRSPTHRPASSPGATSCFGDDVDPDYVLTNVAIYWFTRTAASSMRFY